MPSVETHGEATRLRYARTCGPRPAGVGSTEFSTWHGVARDVLERADLLVLGTPMYNYGMPATLKAWFDQVIRVGRTFSFHLARDDWPLEPILSGKAMVVLSSRGEFGFAAGGVRDSMNHLDPHIATCARYLGVSESHTITSEYLELGGERHERSIRDALTSAAALAERLGRAHAARGRAEGTRAGLDGQAG